MPAKAKANLGTKAFSVFENKVSGHESDYLARCRLKWGRFQIGLPSGGFSVRIFVCTVAFYCMLEKPATYVGSRG